MSSLSRFIVRVCLYAGGVFGVASLQAEKRPFEPMPAEMRAKLPPVAFVRRKGGYGLRGTNATMFAHRQYQRH